VEREAAAERRRANTYLIQLRPQTPPAPAPTPIPATPTTTAETSPTTTLVAETPPAPPKRAYLAIRTPERPPTPARAPPVATIMAPVEEEEVESMRPPPSTAPAAVGRRSGRSNQGRGWDSLVPKARGRGKK
jgi:hypothetical protein